MSKRDSELVTAWRTLGPVGWAESSFGWIGDDGAVSTLTPVRLLPWQRAILGAWWDLRADVTTLALSNIKKTGKTFCNAVLLAWRWLALPGEHFAAANDLDQSAGRQFAMIAEMVRRHPYLKTRCKVGKTRIEFEPTGSVIVALAVDAAGNAGANHLTASHTEAWAIIYETGVSAWDELTPPPGAFYGDFPTLRIADSYAGFDGQSDTWHNLVDRGLAGERIPGEWPIYRAGGVLLFHMVGAEAQERCFRGTPEQAAAYYADQRAQLRPAAFQRFHLNQRTTGAESFVSLEAWDRCEDPAHRPLLPGRPEPLFVGVDAALKHDSAAIVACYFDQDRQKIALARHRIWYPRGQTLDLDATIGSALRELRAGFHLRRVLFDPWQMQALAQQLTAEGLPMEEYPQTIPNLTEMGQNLWELIEHENMVTYSAPDLRQQVAQAVAEETPRGWKITKTKAASKVDAVIALAMAAKAAAGSTGPEAYGEYIAAAPYTFSESEY